jgi:hypothetical protein
MISSIGVSPAWSAGGNIVLAANIAATARMRAALLPNPANAAPTACRRSPAPAYFRMRAP